MAAGVPSLFQISQAVCIKSAGLITDVGDTPYHLVQPIMKRLNAKQLANLEENSPIVLPHSDELWGFLIEKDFPDRPSNTAKLRLMPGKDNEMMPRRALYRQYSGEREQFLATSADRLRKMTERLRKQKSKNSIITVQGILADPTIRRRVPQSASYRSNTQKIRPNTILGKARRDVSQRSLIFGGSQRAYDPYKAFIMGQNTSGSVPPSSVRNVNLIRKKAPANVNDIPDNPLRRIDKESRHDGTHKMATNASNGSQLDRLEHTPTVFESPTKPNIISESVDSSLPNPDSPNPRKRRPPPSIFLNHRKKHLHNRPKALKHDTKSKKTQAKKEIENTGEEHKPIRAIKSSIFH